MINHKLNHRYALRKHEQTRPDAEKKIKNRLRVQVNEITITENEKKKL